jgi:glycerol kinase
VPEARQAGRQGAMPYFGTVESWLIWWLTGGPDGGAHITDVTNASRTLMMNLKTLDWDDDILNILGIPANAAAHRAVGGSGILWGHTLPLRPLGARVPVCGALGDQQAALVGQACFAVGEAKNTYGTGCFLLLNTGNEPVPSRHGLITTVAYQVGGEAPVYCLEGSIAIAGALVQWFRDNLIMIEQRPGDRATGAFRGRQRRRLYRTGLFRAFRPLLAFGRPRGHRGPDAVRQQRPPGPRRPGSQRLSDPATSWRP